MIQIALGDVAEINEFGSGHKADPGEERVMAAPHPNAAISDTFGEHRMRYANVRLHLPAANRTDALQMGRSQLLADFVAKVGGEIGEGLC